MWCPHSKLFHFYFHLVYAFVVPLIKVNLDCSRWILIGIYSVCGCVWVDYNILWLFSFSSYRTYTTKRNFLNQQAVYIGYKFVFFDFPWPNYRSAARISVNFCSLSGDNYFLYIIFVHIESPRVILRMLWNFFIFINYLLSHNEYLFNLTLLFELYTMVLMRLKNPINYYQCYVGFFLLLGTHSILNLIIYFCCIFVFQHGDKIVKRAHAIHNTHVHNTVLCGSITLYTTTWALLSLNKFRFQGFVFDQNRNDCNFSIAMSYCCIQVQ